MKRTVVHNTDAEINDLDEMRDAISGIFDALVRGGTEVNSTTNLGLGLYITKKIITAHGGTISVTSSDKDGTTFTALLPRAADAAVVPQDGIESEGGFQKAVR